MFTKYLGTGDGNWEIAVPKKLLICCGMQIRKKTDKILPWGICNISGLNLILKGWNAKEIPVNGGGGEWHLMTSFSVVINLILWNEGFGKGSKLNSKLGSRTNEKGVYRSPIMYGGCWSHAWHSEIMPCTYCSVSYIPQRKQPALELSLSSCFYLFTCACFLPVWREIRHFWEN